MKEIRITVMMLVVFVIGFLELGFTEEKEYRYKDFVWGMSMERVVSTLLSRGHMGRVEFDSKQNLWQSYHMEDHFGMNCLAIFWFTPAESLKGVELKFEGDRFDVCKKELTKQQGRPDRKEDKTGKLTDVFRTGNGVKMSFWTAKQNKTAILLISGGGATQVFYQSGIK